MNLPKIAPIESPRPPAVVQLAPIPAQKPEEVTAYFSQEKEAAILDEICRRLTDAGISFSQEGQEIICSDEDAIKTGIIFREVLYSKITPKREPAETPPPVKPLPIPNVREIFNRLQEHIIVIETRPPIRPATGKLKELESLFLTTSKKRKQTTSTNEDLIRLFDKYKRLAPDEQQLKELEILI